MSEILNILLYQPIAWLMNLIYNIFGNYGVSIFVITLIVRIILLPPAIKQQRSMAKSTRMQSKIAKIQKKYATNKIKMNEEIQALYEREGLNPMASMGCLPLLIQFPVMIALYNVIYRPLTYVAHLSADVITAAGEALKNLGVVTASNVNGIEMIIINHHNEIAGQVPGLANVDFEQLRRGFTVFGLDLTQSPNIGQPALIWIVPIAAGLASFLMSWITVRQQKKNNPGMSNAAMTGCMTIGMPLFSLYLGFSVPGGVGFYWLCSSIIGVMQQLVMNKFYNPKKVAAELLIDETIERRSKEEYNKNKLMKKFDEK